jgi:predicted transcriptional regulator
MQLFVLESANSHHKNLHRPGRAPDHQGLPQGSQRLILNHDLSGIPPGFQVMLGVVCVGRKSIETDPDIPSSIHEKIILPLLPQAKRFQVASSTLVSEQQIAAAQAVREGGSLQTVTTARIIQELRRKNHALKDESLRSRIELYSRSEINLHLIATETHLFLALPRLDKTYDLENIIISKHPQALE